MRGKVTSRDVAALAGVSRGAVSMILGGRGAAFAEETRARVREAARTLGYAPSAAGRMLVRGSAETIGVVVCHSEMLAHDGFVPQVLGAVAAACRRHGHRVILEVLDGGDGAETYRALVAGRQIDGIIVIDPASGDPELHALIEEGFPLVLLGSVQHRGEASVNFSTRMAIEALVDHLHARGHRRFAFVSHSPAGYVATDARLAALRGALGRRGLTLAEDHVAHGAFSARSGFEATRLLLAGGLEPPAALFAGNDTIAVGALAALAERGLEVPEDVAVTGFDDLPHSAFLAPPLTTVATFAARQGEIAAEMLMSLLRGEHLGHRRVRVPIDLVVRTSTGG